MKIGLSCKTLASEGEFLLPKGRLSEAEAIELLEHAYNRGIRIFDALHEIKETEIKIGKWLQEYPHDDVQIGTKISLEKGKNVEKLLDISIQRLGLNRPIDFFHLTDVSSTDDVPNALTLLRELVKTKKIKRYGIRTHSLPVAANVALKGLSTIQIPINPIEHGFYLRTRDLYKESTTQVIATKVFGGGMFTYLMHDTFLLQMTLSFLQPDDMLFMGVKSIEELDRNMDVCDEYANEKYPIMESHCNGCQMCDEACVNVNNYPLSKWIRYCRYLDSDDIYYAEWAVQKIEQEKIEMNCFQCKRCENVCPTKLKIKKYIQDRVLKVTTRIKY